VLNRQLSFGDRKAYWHEPGQDDEEELGGLQAGNARLLADLDRYMLDNADCNGGLVTCFEWIDIKASAQFPQELSKFYTAHLPYLKPRQPFNGLVGPAFARGFPGEVLLVDESIWH
jgi:hypothetical protein